MSGRKRRDVLARGVAWLLGLPLALALLAATVLLGVPSARAAAVRYGLDYLERSLGFRVQIGRVERLDPWAIVLRDIRVRDPKQQDLGSIEELSLRMQPFELLQQTLHVTEARLSHVRARYDLEALLAEPSAPEEPDSGPSRFVVRADHLLVLDTQLETPWRGRKVVAEIDALEGGGTWSARPRVALQRAELRARADADEILRLSAPRGSWSADKGGTVKLTGAVAGAALDVACTLGPLEGTPWFIEQLDLNLRGVDHEALRRLGVSDSFDLSAPITLEAHAKSSREEVALDAQLALPEARVTLAAHANLAHARADLEIAPITLARVSPMLPALRVQGSLRAEADYAREAIPLSLAWRAVAVDGQSVPDGKARVVLAMPIVRVTSLALDGLGSRLSFAGSYDTERGLSEGKLALHQLQLASIALLRAQGVAGELSGDVDFALREHGRLRGRVKLRGDGLSVANRRLDALLLEASLAGTKERPQGTLALDASGLDVDGTKLDALQARADLTPQSLRGTLDGHGMNAALHSELSGTRGRQGDLTLNARGQAHALDKALDFALEELQIRGDTTSLKRLAVHAGEQTVLAQGSYEKRGAIRADVDLRALDLASWGALLGKPQLRGTLDGSAQISGTLRAPHGHVNLGLTKLSVMGEPEADAALQADADLDQGRVGAELTLRSASDGSSVKLAATLTSEAKRRALRDALEQGSFEVNGQLHLPASRLLMLGDQRISALQGHIDVDLSGHGSLADPHLEVRLMSVLGLPEKPAAKPESLQATLRVEPEDATLALVLTDDRGRLLDVDLSAPFSGGSLEAALAQPAPFAAPAFTLRAELDERRLDTMQGGVGYLVGAYQLALPVRVGAKLALTSDGQAFDGDAAVRLVVFGDKIDASCVAGSSSSVHLDTQLRRGDVALTITSQGDAAGRARIEAKTHVDLAALLQGHARELERLQVDVRTRQLDLSKLPGLCALKSGQADVDLRAGVFGARAPELESTIDVRELRGPRGAAFGAHLALRAQTEGAHMRASLRGDVRVDGKPHGTIDVSLPLSGDPQAIPSVAPDAAVQAHVRFSELPLSGPLSAVPALGQVSGSASADLSVTGTLAAPEPQGFLELHEVGFSIASLAQPVRHLNGRVELQGRELAVKQLSAKDGEGSIKLSGGARLDANHHGKGRIHITADRFPMRQEGTVVGELTLDTEVGAQIEGLRDLSVDVDINRGRLWLTGDQGRDVQALDPNPDIVFDDLPPEAQADAAGAGDAASVALRSLTIKSHRDMWVMHTDFSVQVALDLALREGPEGAVMRGDAEITRGELQILGKTFKIQKGTIHFTGDVPPDPDLNLKASYQPPSSQPLNVQVTGLASAPVLTFTGAATNIGEAVSILSGVGRAKPSSSNSSAQQDVSNFATTLTAGLLSVAARRKFGDWVPTLGVETNASGQVNGARAGFDASDMIPRFMRSFARGAYVEGIVGGTSQTQGGSVGVGVRLDLSLPHDFVTSMGYGPGTRWSADLLWAP